MTYNDELDTNISPTMYQKISRAILWVFPWGMKPKTGKASYNTYNGPKWYEMTIYKGFKFPKNRNI